MKYIKATKNWGPCACNCGKIVGSGDMFAMVAGSMYLKGHENKATGYVPLVKKEGKGDSSSSGKRKKQQSLPEHCRSKAGSKPSDGPIDISI